VLKLLALAALGLVLVTSILDHVGAFGYRGETLDRQQVEVLAAVDAETVRVKTSAGQEDVHLLGINAPASADHWGSEALRYTTARLVGRTVTLRVEPTQMRDERGRVLACVYVTDADLMNLDMIRDGQAYADRRVQHPQAKQFEQVEGEARNKKRGMWKDLTEDQMPAWRQKWLREWRAQHPR